MKFFNQITQAFAGRGWRKRFPILNWVYRWFRRTFSPRVAFIDGHKMKLDNQDSLNLSKNQLYEPYQTSLVKKWIKPGNTVLDIGANIGYYTLIFARLVGNQGRVFSFEPEPTMFSILTENVALNSYPNVTMLQKAVSDKDGTMDFFADAFSNLDHRLYPSPDVNEVSFPVDVVRLDSLPELKDTHVDLIKMDIQGAECAALKGMSTLLSKNKDLLLLAEFWPKGLHNFGTPPNEYYELLKMLGFSIFEINETAEKITPVKSLQDVLSRCSIKPYYVNIVCVKGNRGIFRDQN